MLLLGRGTLSKENPIRGAHKQGERNIFFLLYIPTKLKQKEDAVTFPGKITSKQKTSPEAYFANGYTYN